MIDRFLYQNHVCSCAGIYVYTDYFTWTMYTIWCLLFKKWAKRPWNSSEYIVCNVCIVCILVNKQSTTRRALCQLVQTGTGQMWMFSFLEATKCPNKDPTTQKFSVYSDNTWRYICANFENFFNRFWKIGKPGGGLKSFLRRFNDMYFLCILAVPWDV